MQNQGVGRISSVLDLSPWPVDDLLLPVSSHALSLSLSASQSPLIGTPVIID